MTCRERGRSVYINRREMTLEEDDRYNGWWPARFSSRFGGARLRFGGRATSERRGNAGGFQQGCSRGLFQAQHRTMGISITRDSLLEFEIWLLDLPHSYQSSARRNWSAMSSSNTPCASCGSLHGRGDVRIRYRKPRAPNLKMVQQ